MKVWERTLLPVCSVSFVLLPEVKVWGSPSHIGWGRAERQRERERALVSRGTNPTMKVENPTLL